MTAVAPVTPVFLQIRQTDAVLRLSVSETCWLRLLEESDVDELYALIDENRAYLSRWMPWAAAQSSQDTLAFIRMTRRQLAENNGLQTALVCNETIVGVVGYHAVDWGNRSTSIGYWLGEQYQGQGTMTQAVRVLLDHALGTWNLNRVEVRAAPDNRRSRAILERLGFREEGVLRAAERIEGRFLDSVVYGMLACEWQARG
jgi:ribosomal-protein-serine acetyltransferase